MTLIVIPHYPSCWETANTQIIIISKHSYCFFYANYSISYDEINKRSRSTNVFFPIAKSTSAKESGDFY